jgi:hypothetical protein
MTRYGQRNPHERSWAFAYAALCLIVTAAGWTTVMLMASDVDATAPSASAIAAGPTRTTEATPTVEITPGTTPLNVGDAPAAAPTKAAFNIDLYRPGTFVSQITREFCMAGAVQNMVNIIGPASDLSSDRQQQIGDLLVSLTSAQDSYNGGFGPIGWSLIMSKLGAGQYQLVIDATFDKAMKDAAVALAKTMRPVGLLTWWGAHSWVMTGFKSDSDPLLTPDTFKLKGAYIVDPFYPRVSSIWGQTLGPDSFRDMTAMANNFIPWKRPEGRYPDRDGKWLLVIPVDPPASASPSAPASASPSA